MRAIILTFLTVASLFQVEAQTFTLTSENLGGQMTNEQVFNGFGCTGDNLSPHLAWKHAPEGTKSFAITVYDPDAPTGSGWWHWVVFNIPVNTNTLKRGAGDSSLNLLPKGSIQSMTDYGKPEYGGPCPPEGDGLHRYVITVYALSIDNIELDTNASPALVGFYLNANSLGKASLITYFQR